MWKNFTRVWKGKKLNHQISMFMAYDITYGMEQFYVLKKNPYVIYSQILLNYLYDYHFDFMLKVAII